MQQEPETDRLIVEACVCLHNLMRIRYPALQNAAMDRENDNHDVVFSDWRENANMHYVNQARGGNFDSTAAKRLREYLKLYFNSPVGAVHWQDDMI